MLSKRKTQSAQVLDPAQQFAMLCCMRPLRLSVRIAALSAEITEVYEELKEKREFFRQYNHLIHGDMKSSARNEVKQLQRKFNELRAEKRHLESVDRAMADRASSVLIACRVSPLQKAGLLIITPDP